MEPITFRACTEEDRPHIIHFLESVKDDFPSIELKRQTIEEITELLFLHGGVLAGYKQGTMMAMLGYFLGEPAQNYANKEVGFIYLTALAPSVRLTRFFLKGIIFSMKTLQEMGVPEVRFHASADDRYTNRLYARFAQFIGQENNRRGYPCNLYAADISTVLAILTKNKQAKMSIN